MLNIEIHGLNVWEGEGPGAKVRDAIFDLFKEKLFVGKMVVTMIPNDVWDHWGKSQSFLRVWSSDEEEISPIVEELKQLGMDIEFKKLDGFVPGSPGIIPIWRR